MAKAKRRSLTRYDLFSTHGIPALIVFFTMMVLVGFSWRTAQRAIDDTQQEELSERARFTETNIHQRILLNENTLRAAASLFYDEELVNRQQWADFVASLELKERMPGIIGIGYSEFLTPAQLSAYEQQMINEGFTNFKIQPIEPPRDVYSSVTLIEPMDERNRQALGVDMYADPVRRLSMIHARDNETTSMSEITPVLQDQKTIKNGVTLYHPVYRSKMPTDTAEQRQAAILGFVYAPLSVDSLFNHIFPDKDSDFNFKIYDSDSIREESILYEQFPDADDNSYNWVHEDNIKVADQTWVIRYGVRDNFVPEPIRDRPNNIIFGGTIFASVVAAIVYLLLQRRTRVIRDKQKVNLESAKDSLLSLASHQLRTPATGVKQYIGMVLEGFVGKLSLEQRDLLTKAYDSNERQLRIINEFLYLAKADAGRIVISPQSFDLVSFTEAVLRDMHSEIDEAEHIVNVKKRPKQLTAFADTHSTRMIIENLISNSIKYTPNGGKIEISFRKKGNYSLFIIKDNGVGIDKKDFPLLFKQFSRIPNELTRQTSGSGIGLFLASYLAKINGGTITVESIRNVGSTFTASFRSRGVKKLTDVARKRK